MPSSLVDPRRKSPDEGSAGEVREAGPSESRSGTRPTAPDRGSVDSLLLDYLSKPTVPNMQAVAVAIQAYTVPVPRASGLPTRPPTSESSEIPRVLPSVYEDERPTGRCPVSIPARPLELVRDRGVLVRLDGDAGGEVVSVPRGTIEVGRSTRAHVHVADPSVSRSHARIVYEYGAYFVEDLSSQNGTLLAGRRVARAELRDGDLLQFGQYSIFRFSLMDMTQEQVMRRLYDSSTRDPLTGAENRRSLDSRLLAEIAFAQRHKRPLSTVLLDIDHFKLVNDKYGHPAGDEVLRRVAALIRGQLRTEDSFARYGGEEFAVVLRDTETKEAALVGERIRARIAREPMELDGTAITVTVSAGCSSLSSCVGFTTEELIGIADRRLYRAKRSGRNRVVSDDEG